MTMGASERQRGIKPKVGILENEERIEMLKYSDWDLGYKAGIKGEPSEIPSSVDGVSWLSGFTEGKAMRNKGEIS